MQYKNANGKIFGIVHSESSTIAYCNGSFVAEAETERELENILETISLSNTTTT